MSQDNSQSTRKATIKIAAKDASQRNSAGGADPGPGDMSAAPSVAPQLVDIPDPPTGSQLVVKSTTAIPTLHEGRSGTMPSGSKGPKSIVQASMSGGAGASGSKQHHSHSHHGSGSKHLSGSHHSHQSMQGSQVGPAASQPSAAREPTSSRPLTGPPESSVGGSAPKSSPGLAKSTSGAGVDTAPRSVTGMSKSTPGTAAAAEIQPTSPATASQAMQADSGVVHDEDEEGEGELVGPEASPSAAAAAASPMSQATTSPASSAGGSSAQSSVKSSGGGAKSGGADASPTLSPSGLAGSRSSSKMSTRASSADAGKEASATADDINKSSVAGSSAVSSGKDAKNKVTKFRYHKRITVRTTGKTSPAAIMDKVNKKDHQAGITPSTIEDMDPQELMKRAGIKGNKKTHWRVRLRQTKRLTKNGKTTTQTKVAYRDSEGNKRVKTSSNPFCKNCGKMLEQCKCDAQSQS